MKMIIKTWLPLAILASLFFAAVYVTAQQMVRQSYNWPQIDAVNLASARLTHDETPAQVIGRYGNDTPIDQTGTLFVTVYDEDFKAIVSSGSLDGRAPDVPKGILQNSDPTPAYHAVTWAPRTDVRVAAVTQKVNYDNKVYYVLAGRNLKQPELLTEYVLLLCASAWLGTVFVSLLVVALLQPNTRERLARRSYRS